MCRDACVSCRVSHSLFCCFIQALKRPHITGTHPKPVQVVPAHSFLCTAREVYAHFRVNKQILKNYGIRYPVIGSSQDPQVQQGGRDHDYARKQWSGLVRDVYIPRARLYEDPPLLVKPALSLANYDGGPPPFFKQRRVVPLLSALICLPPRDCTLRIYTPICDSNVNETTVTICCTSVLYACVALLSVSRQMPAFVHFW